MAGLARRQSERCQRHQRSGAVVGLSYTATNSQHAFLWTQSGGMQDLTPISPALAEPLPSAINSSNQVAGYYFPERQQHYRRLHLDPGRAGFRIWARPALSPMPSTTRARWSGKRNLRPAMTARIFLDSEQPGNARIWARWAASRVPRSRSTTRDGSRHFPERRGSGLSARVLVDAIGRHAGLCCAGGHVAQQTYSVQVNDFGVIALSTNNGCYLLIPKMSARVTSSANPSVVGQPVTFTATMNSIAGPPPDGEMVQFLVSGKVVGRFPERRSRAVHNFDHHRGFACRRGQSMRATRIIFPRKYTVSTQVVNP